jgi:hypothetical protein
MRKSSVAGLVALLLVNACSLLFPVPDGSEPADAGVADPDPDESQARPVFDSGDAPVSMPEGGGVFEDGGDGGATGVRCPVNVRGPKLVPVDTYCIDRTPVTMAQYRAFQDASVPLDAMPPGCEAKVAYGFYPLPGGGVPAPDTPALVDWCEAYVYCRWAGKRLCRAVDQGALPYNDDAVIADRQQNAWLHACTGPNGTVYPYGNIKNPDACMPRRAVEQPDCQGGYPGIFDFTSNGEWLDSCEDMGCVMMMGAPGAPCRSYFKALRVSMSSTSGAFGGIRCCWP